MPTLEYIIGSIYLKNSFKVIALIVDINFTFLLVDTLS
jgi:hypothetical protein